VLVPYVDQSHTARVVLGISLAAFVVGELAIRVRERRGASRADLGTETLFRVLLVAGILMLPIGRVLVQGAAIGGGAWVFGLGGVIGWLGLLLRWWSVATLGQYFTVVVKTSEDQPVVDRGPYRVLRHPSYTGLLLAVGGVGLMLGNWLSLLGGVVLVLLALMYRIRVEERALSEALGTRYRDYAASRARLVPFVW
jgi:protein-S-isoprenylcysteine O-methyltransferase Ste14